MPVGHRSAQHNKPTHYKLSPQASSDLQHWAKNNPTTIKRISDLIESTMATPFTGIGKPKPLRYSLEGYWSRRITSEHRFIYRINETTLEIIALRGHYDS